jgi:curli biogenesis system outer membrane secretion channel CsgG
VITPAAVAAGLLSGCQNGRDLAEECVKPTVAVMKFENRAPFPMNWNLGDGMKDIMVDRLMATRRFRVIERPEIDSVIRELQFQNTGATRQERRAQMGRLTNVEYLIKGTVTDFGHVAAARGFLGLPSLDIFGGHSRAIMGLTFYVVEVESGEIICSQSLEESVSASDMTVKAVYRDVAMGGSVFYKTPLGRAAAKVIDRAVGRVGETIAARPWVPKVALVQDDGMVVVNGGANRSVRAGTCFEVFERGQPIHDPDTGDVIGQQPGKSVGRIEIREVCKLYSVGAIVAGRPADFQIGQHCRREETMAAR